MSSTETAVEPVRRAITVNRPVEDAFRIFTDGIATSMRCCGPRHRRESESRPLSDEGQRF